MSDSMLHGILQMPPNLWSNDAIDIAQRHGRYLEASKRIIELERERDEAREDLSRVDAARRQEYGEAFDAFSKVVEERDEARRECSEAQDGWSKALDERDDARRSLKHIEEYGAEKINAAVSLRQELTKARFERDEAMQMLGEQLYQRINEWTEEVERLLGELNAAREEVSALKAKLDRVSQMDQHADKSSVGDSTYVLTQQPCQRASRVGMETDWYDDGYRDGRAAALSSGGTIGPKWHADQKQLQGLDANEYIAGFNDALDEYE